MLVLKSGGFFEENEAQRLEADAHKVKFKASTPDLLLCLTIQNSPSQVMLLRLRYDTSESKKRVGQGKLDEHSQRAGAYR